MLLATKIFIDTGDPTEVRRADALLKMHGFGGIDGVTTNPTGMMQYFQKLSHNDSRFSRKEADRLYQHAVQEIATITKGPISVQVIGNPETFTKEEMIAQARKKHVWSAQSVIKLPCVTAGFAAAEVLCQEMPVNMTINYSQEQAAAAYVATRYHDYPVFVSPYVGKQDDRGINGMDLVANSLNMFHHFGDGHVRVLVASIRHIKHIHYSLWLKADAITMPLKVLETWAADGFSFPEEEFLYEMPGLVPTPYRELSLDEAWTGYHIAHELTTASYDTFWHDWKKVVDTESPDR